jgi:hypothetical protein
MNLCITVTVTTFVVIIILLRILFAMMEIGYYALNDEIIVPINLRELHASALAYERFEKIHKQVLLIAATGGHKHQFNLCFKDPKVSKTIEAMVKEAFPDSNVESSKNGTCTTCKITW